MDKKDFLHTVSNYSRDEFKQYLYKDIHKKRKLVDVILIDKSKIKSIKNNSHISK